MTGTLGVLAIIVPSLTCASKFWWSRTLRKTDRSNLYRGMRFFLKDIIVTKRSTDWVAMWAMMCLSALALHIKTEVIKITYRPYCVGGLNTNSKRHRLLFGNALWGLQRGLSIKSKETREEHRTKNHEIYFTDWSDTKERTGARFRTPNHACNPELQLV